MDKVAKFNFDLDFHTGNNSYRELEYKFEGDMDWFEEEVNRNENPEWDDMVSYAEQYGVLDCGYSPNTENFGYGSYEVYESDIPKVIKYFTDYFDTKNIKMILVSDITKEYSDD